MCLLRKRSIFKTYWFRSLSWASRIWSFFRSASEINSFREFISDFKTIEPLSNFQIIDKCKTLKIKNFKGVFMRDEIKNKSQNENECMIINIDHSDNEGTHW